MLLLSNSTQPDRGYLDHAIEEMLDLLGEIRRLLFVPFALHDRAGYATKFADRMALAGVEADALGAGPEGVRQIEGAQAVFVGGGNTFRLLRTMQEAGLLEPLRSRTVGGMPYLGASAGINLACPTIRTTNDMPIVQPPSFAALGLVPFQINPHYLDPDPGSQHMGETRAQRIEEFLEENERIVVGLREGGWIRREGDSCRLGGARGARVFRRDAEPEERSPGDELTDLLNS
jgi:dipeptidase E